jgi:glycerophosphoryl diester phosphodiesterase
MVLLVGHRGAKGEAPENTIGGFAYALSLGLTAIEIDIHMTSDGELVVIHDPTVDRTTDGTGTVAEMTAADIAALDARGDFPAWQVRLGVPTLEEALTALASVPHLELEIKTDSPARLERVCERVSALVGRFGLEQQAFVMSFDPVVPEIMREIAPHIRRGFIGAYRDDHDLNTALAFGCTKAGIPLVTGSVEMVQAAKSRGLIVAGWMGNSEDALDTLIGWGVDTITTDYPTMALAHLAKRTAPVSLVNEVAGAALT